MELQKKTKSGCFGYEIGEKCGTPHMQCAVQFKHVQNMTELRKKMKGFDVQGQHTFSTPAKLFSYCMKGTGKSGTFECPGPNWEGKHWGKFPGEDQGERTDLKGMQSCQTMQEVFEVAEKLQDVTYMEKFFGHKMEAAVKTEIIWDRRVDAADLYEDAYFKDETSWWSAYDGQETVVLEEPDAKLWTKALCGRLTKARKTRVEMKGSTRQFTTKTIVICCEDVPSGIWAAFVVREIPAESLEEEVIIHPLGVTPLRAAPLPPAAEIIIAEIAHKKERLKLRQEMHGKQSSDEQHEKLITVLEDELASVLANEPANAAADVLADEAFDDEPSG